MNLSQSELARRIGVKPGVVNEICNKRRAVSPRVAILPGKAFGMSPEFWNGLQADHDLTKEMQSGRMKKALRHVEPVSV